MRVAIRIGLLSGIGIRVALWASDRPLWLDEAMLSLGIIARPLRGVLAAPLPYHQFAPPGFVAAQWVAVAAFGNGERALRVVPLVAGLVALALCTVLARHVLRDGVAVAVATWLVALNRALVYYSTEAKPYSVDVAVALLLVLATLWAIGRGVRRALVAGAVGAALVWFSFPAVLVLAGLAIVWAIRAPRTAAGAVVPWVASAVPAVWIATVHVAPAERAYLDRFWADGFWTGWWWPIVAPARALDALLRVPPGAVWLALAVIGVLMMRPLRGGWAFVLAPVGVAAAAATAGLYPFASRLVLFLLPAALLGVAGIARRRWGQVLVAVIVAAQGVECILPTGREDVRAIAVGLAARRAPGDDVYVYYGAAPTFAYYAGVNPGVSQARHATDGSSGAFRRVNDVTVGGCHRADWRGYLRELDALRGRRRVWLVVAHAFDGAGVREDSLLVRYLRSVGQPRETIAAHDAFAVLFDLSGIAAADRRSTDQFDAPRSARPSLSGLACDGV